MRMLLSPESFYPQCGFLALGTRISVESGRTISRFYPQCGFLALGTQFSSEYEAAFAEGFYPQCGFLALGTELTWDSIHEDYVSIRNADFWLWEQLESPRNVPVAMFLSAMRIFGFGNVASLIPVRN